jgi:hypothetical protein
MAGLDRESIMAAVATKLAAVPGLVTFSRRFRDLDKVSVNEQPAIFLVADREAPQHQKAMPTKWMLHLGVFIYAITSDPAVAPATVLAPLVRAVEAALQWASGDVGPFAPNTPGSLGRLDVQWCRLGEVQYGEGATIGQGVVFVPLEIFAMEQGA